MRIYGDNLSVNSSDFYNIGQQPRSEALRRVAESRKRLQQHSGNPEPDPFSEEDLLSRWMEGRLNPLDEDDGGYWL